MYNIYYTDNCNTFPFDNKSFNTLEEAKEFCDNEVKDGQPYDVTDSPDTNNHYRFEVYDGDPIILLEDGGAEYREPVYSTKDYYKD